MARRSKRIPQRRSGRAPEITVNVTQEIIDRARREGLSGAQMIALAIQESIPGASDIEVNGQNLWSPGSPHPDATANE